MGYLIKWPVSVYY